MAREAALMDQIDGVLCCGNVVFDIAVWPVEDMDWNQTRWVDTIAECIGGNGANTSYALATLGVPAKLISQVGADERGDRLIGILARAGVDASGIAKVHGFHTPTTAVLIQNGGARKFYHRPGASRELDPDAIQFDGSSYNHFHLANPFALSRIRATCGDVMRRAKERGLTTSIDTAWDSLGRWMEDLAPALPHTDLLFVNDSEEEMLGGSEELRRHGVRDIVVKTGPRGCIVNGLEIPGFRVDAVDTTGAGDCFAGAFLAGIHHGLAPEECGRLANAVGAMNVQHLGATTGVRSLQETRAWMESQPGS
jgi:sugar/nucleoside kinase (ribokinase family)